MISLNSLFVFHLYLQRHKVLSVGSLSFSAEIRAVNRHCEAMSRPTGQRVSISRGETDCPATTSLLLAHIPRETSVAPSLITQQPYTWLILSQSTRNMFSWFPFLVVPGGTLMLQAVNTDAQLVYWAALSPPLDPCSYQSPTLSQFVVNLYFSSRTLVGQLDTDEH